MEPIRPAEKRGNAIQHLTDLPTSGVANQLTTRDAHLRPTQRPQAYGSARARRRPVLHGLMLGLIALGVVCSVLVSRTFPFGRDDGATITGLALPNIGASSSADQVLVSSVLPSTVRREQTAQALSALADPAAQPQNTEGEAAAVVEQPPVEPYQLYTVAEGDTASAIASRFGVGLQYLLWANPDLRDGELLVVGQTLIVPAGNGVLHHLRYGETLSDVAARYGVTVDDILAWQGNGISSADQVVEDQLVFVPDGTLPAAAPEPTAEPTQPPVLVTSPPDDSPVASNQSVSSGLIWPVSGPISSYMDASHPLGIDIDLYNNPYTSVVAATSGTVTFAGGDACCSYGYYVIVMSPDGIETLYAHFSSISVSAGQTVSQGDVLGTSGCTGYCTGNHLHFEVIDTGTRVDPLAYLP